MKKWQSIFTMIGGFILPVAAFVLGMLIGDEDSFLNVMPTVIHKALVFTVPVINLAIWICLRRGAGKRILLRAICGFSVGVSLVYTVMLLPLIVMGLIGFCLMFWYFGVGFLGLIACAPATALASGLIFRSRLAAVDAARDDAKAGGFGRGLLAAAVMWVFLFCDAGLAYFGCRTGMSSDPAVAARGIRLARLSSPSSRRRGWRFHGRRMKLSDASPFFPARRFARLPRLQWQGGEDDPPPRASGLSARGLGGAAAAA